MQIGVGMNTELVYTGVGMDANAHDVTWEHAILHREVT